MEKAINRRDFLKKSMTIPFISAAGLSLKNDKSYSQKKITRIGGPHIKITCNAYSYNDYFRQGKMTLDDLFELCAKMSFDGVDPTAYYFPGYPDVPDDEYIYHIKRKAFLLGLDISGTGIINDFTNPDKNKREADAEHVRKWMECASRLGSPVLRIFGGRGIPDGYSEEEVTGWVVEGIKRCAEYGKRYGVMAAIQNHNDFFKTAEQCLKVLRMVNSDWIGLMVDIGSFVNTDDPYGEIAKAAPYAVSWQIKQYMTLRGKKEKIDLNKIVTIMRNADYRGYISVEHIGEGDPKIIMPLFLDEVRRAIG